MLTIKGRLVRTGAVGGHDDHKVLALVARAVEHGVDGAAHGLALLAAAARAQERVGLVHEEHHAAGASACPVEDAVQLLHRRRAQRRHVAAGHDGVIQARRVREPLCQQRLTRTRRACTRGTRRTVRRTDT